MTTGSIAISQHQLFSSDAESTVLGPWAREAPNKRIRFFFFLICHFYFIFSFPLDTEDKKKKKTRSQINGTANFSPFGCASALLPSNLTLCRKLVNVDDPQMPVFET